MPFSGFFTVWVSIILTGTRTEPRPARFAAGCNRTATRPIRGRVRLRGVPVEHCTGAPVPTGCNTLENVGPCAFRAQCAKPPLSKRIARRSARRRMGARAAARGLQCIGFTRAWTAAHAHLMSLHALANVRRKCALGKLLSRRSAHASVSLPRTVASASCG